ncbi:MAG: YlxR family protein [Chloroflexota bacterium]|nr:MAG: YlxR family protein [Chloroflexota bacterium]
MGRKPPHFLLAWRSGLVKQRRKHIPQRTCVACRRKLDKRRLTRIVRSAEEGVVVDPSGKRNGRGAYLCDQPDCWDEALTGSILDRALQTQVNKAQKDQLATHKPLA